MFDLDKFNRTMANSAQNKAEEFSQTLQGMAEGSGWPSDVVSRLRVTFVDGMYIIDIPPDLRDTVDDLEYGTPHSPPAAVIRLFTARYMDDANNDLASEVLNYLYDEEAFL